MVSPTEYFIDKLIDKLAAQATVETYGDTSFITLPDLPNGEKLSESHRMTAFKKAEQRLIPPPNHLDADALRARLEFITPPPNQEEDEEECRLLEAQARQDLESDGCPPCYPPHLHVPIRDPPEEYRQIVEYWNSFSSTDDVILCAQRSDWREFRDSQRRLRHRYRKKPFSDLEDEVRERRRAHGLDGSVHLLVDPQQQSRQQNWIEFQDYHLKVHELQEKKRDRLQAELEYRAVHISLEYAERILRWHKVFLRWIEQCRVEMDPPPPTPFEKGSGGQNPSSNRQQRSKRGNTPAVLGKARVLKSTPKGRNIRKPISVDSAATVPQITERREIKPRRAKEKALGQLLPQKVAKANRFADSGTKSRDQARPHHQSATQQLHPTPRTVKTRSQRISRPPVRWAPE